jgi:hypothetical protein
VIPCLCSLLSISKALDISPKKRIENKTDMLNS